MTSKMTSRQRLNQVLLSVTGEDIRLVGNWERLPGLFGNAEQLAERLAQVPQFGRWPNFFLWGGRVGLGALPYVAL